MKGNRRKRNLYFYQWSKEYMNSVSNFDRVTCSIRDFEYDDNLSDFNKIKNMGIELCAYLPVLWKENEVDNPGEIENLIDGIYVGNASQLEWAKKIGKRIYGDNGLNVFNGETVKFYLELGISGLTISYELEDSVEDLVDCVNDNGLDNTELEILRYGRVPAMVSEYCPLAGSLGVKGSGCGKCMEHNPVYLRDYMDERYPILLNNVGCTSLILNKAPLNRKNNSKALGNYKNGIERIVVFDESPSFLKRI